LARLFVITITGEAVTSRSRSSPIQNDFKSRIVYKEFKKLLIAAGRARQNHIPLFVLPITRFVRLSLKSESDVRGGR
jgi:hypothetical protein